MIFKEADINQDGKITLDEFKKVIVLLQVDNSRAILVRNSAQFSHALPSYFRSTRTRSAS